MRKFLSLFYLSFVLVLNQAIAQKEIPFNRVLAPDELNEYLNDDIKRELSSKHKISEAVLAEYFRNKFSERFFYDWSSFPARFETYNQLYNNSKGHKSRADEHMQKFAAKTFWLLPFTDLTGEKVTPYAYRHLARQHKMVDVAFEYFYENKNPLYLRYFIEQRNSLNEALKNSKYEKTEDGNGAYEAFRCGYRVLNWLMIHNMFLGEKAYSDHDQLITIATLLQHGSVLYEQNKKYQPGNHQTRGVSALALIAILFHDFKGTDLWYKRSMELLEEHLAKEVNSDGFQFERSVHYHMSDIDNYFYVYQLTQINKIEVRDVWKKKIESLFTTLIKIAYPDKSAPVLQDDTERTWAEKNDISETLTLGYLLFNDPEMGYFANNKVNEFTYWFLQKAQLDQLDAIKQKQPTVGSVEFPETRYYVMRGGWNMNDNMMIISAGMDPYKPDHQHGDMLGIQAMANGQVILPNYQVNYPLPDYQFFKNSLVKNVALVDNELQGKNWTGNQGESGFGKFKQLPVPTTIAWRSNNNFDFFAGSHNGFDNVGVKYSRQIIYVKNDFWIVKDNFNSEFPHEYKQVWQGHYSLELQPDLIRSNFADATGCDIYQLISTDKVTNSGARGKQWSVVSKEGEKNFGFLTVIYPYSGYNNRINELTQKQELKNWKLNNLSYYAEGSELRSLSNKNEAYIFNVNRIKLDDFELTFDTDTDVYLQLNQKQILIKGIGAKMVRLTLSGCNSVLLNSQKAEKTLNFSPGDNLELE